MGGGGGIPMPGGGSSGGTTGGGSGGSTAGDPAGVPGGGESGGGSGDAGSGETLEDLDGQLDESLEDFDSSVGDGSGGSGDQDTIDILSPSGGGGSGVPSDEPLFEEGELSDGDVVAENSELEARAGEGGASGGEASDSSVGGPGGSGGGTESAALPPIPEDIDDGKGDDIVLRQIRDAAMKEKDPVLREKLWDEYRRIKASR